jgi:hypothetical protein
MEMPEIVAAGKIFEPHRQQVTEAILAICVKGLMPAFEELKKIRTSANERLPILNARQLYEGLNRSLWVAYKGLTQTAAELIGPRIGFLFTNDRNFEKGAIAFSAQWPAVPSWFVPYLREQRTKWQNDLNIFRDFLEHGSHRADYESRYHPEHAEKLFDYCWRTIANILAVLLGLYLEPTVLVEVPIGERDPVMPRRFRFAVPGLSAPDELNQSFIRVGPR